MMIGNCGESRDVKMMYNYGKRYFRLEEKWRTVIYKPLGTEVVFRCNCFNCLMGNVVKIRAGDN